MSEISSSKNKSTIYASKIRMRSDQTGTYSATAGWNSVGVGFALTVPETAFYIVKTLASVNVNAGDGRIAIGVDDTPIIYTSQRVYQPVGVEYYVPISLETEPIYLTTGQVVTLMMKENSGGQSLGYTAADYGGYISLEQVESSVSVRNISDDYSTSEIDTGKNWIDGKRIYRKVIDTGAMPNATIKSVAHGITTIENLISVSCIAYDGSSYKVWPNAHTTDIYNLYVLVNTTNVRLESWANESTFTVSKTILEYTKV